MSGRGSRKGIFDLLYRVLLFAYPADFRRRFATEMLQVARDQQRECLGTQLLALTRLRLLMDLLVGACTEQWLKVRNDGHLPRLCSASLAIAISVSLLMMSHTNLSLASAARPVHPSNGWLGIMADVFSPLMDPTVAFLLLTAGLYGLIFEVSSPGTVLPGVLGALCTAGGALALTMLPLNYLGLTMVFFSFGISLAGIKLPVHGILTSSGFVLFLAGALTLFNFGNSGLSISGPVVVTTSILTSLFFGALARLGAAAREMPPAIGPGDLIGKIAEARTSFDGTGRVFVRGEWWNAVCEHGVSQGSRVQVVAREGLTLTVRPLVAA